MSSVNIKKLTVKLEKSQMIPKELPKEIIKTSVEDVAYQKVLDFINKIPCSNSSNISSSASYCIQISLTKTNTIYNGACHASMYSIPSTIVLGSGYRFIAKDPVGLRFWKWITDKNKSPWKAITSGGIELITADNGDGLGWIINNKETLERVPFYFLKNFCILSRTISEHINRYKFWYDLVENHDVDEADAFYLCSMFINNGISLSPSDVRNGGHWALCDYVNDSWHGLYRLDWDKFRTGNINFDPIGPKINGFWTSKINQYKAFDIKNDITNSTIKKTSFSTCYVYDTQNIIDSFYSWQKKQGIFKGATS